MTFDLRNGFPLLTSKKIGWKTVLRELLWFIDGSTDNKKLQEKCSIVFEFLLYLV